MKANIRLIKKHRHFEEAFKKQLVKEFETGKYSVAHLGRLHTIQDSIIYRWIYKYSTFNEKGYRMVERKQSTSQKVKDLENRIKELERKVGQKQIKIDFLETMMEVAKDELDIDIKKNFSTQRSGDSKKGK